MSDFHFLRPWWLLALVPAALLLWALRRKTDSTRSWRGVIAPHLLSHLLVGRDQKARGTPLVLLLIGWLAAVLALSGPTYEREPAPFADDSTALVVVLKVTPSMQTPDIEPSRLARSVQKVHDLLALRPGSKTALIAYSGSAHVVMPLTTDATIIESFASDLDPSVLPTEGDVAANALKKASNIVTKSGQRGWVLWIADAAAPDQLPPLRDYRKNTLTPVTILAAAGEGPELDSLKNAATALGTSSIPLTPDDADVHRLANNARFSAATDGTEERWRDCGYWFVPLLAAINLAWFRRGWVLPTGATA
jgi:Ca-activated chloride channel family protein